MALLFLAAPLPAAEGPLTWDDLVHRAAARNPALAAARLEEEAADARHAGAFNGYLPRADVSQRLSRSDGADRSWRAAVDASWDVVNGAAFAERGATAAARARASASRVLASADLRLSLFTAYARTLFAARQIDVATRVRELRESNAAMVDLKYRGGREYKGNALRAAAEAARARSDEAAARRAGAVSLTELARQIGDETFSVRSVTGTLAPAPPGPAPDWDALAAGHPSLTAAAAAANEAAAALRRTVRSRWPTLSIGYSRFRDGPTYFPGEDGWSASGALRWPLLAGGPTAPLFEAVAARKSWRAAEEDLRAERLRRRPALESAWAAWADAVDQVEVQRRFLTALEQQYAEATVRYTSGLMSFENWSTVVSDLVNAQRGALAAERDAALAEAAWRNARADPLEAR